MDSVDLRQEGVNGTFAADYRGVSPVVAKTLAIGIALLYVAGISTALLGGVVPAYETRAGAEIAERTLATAAGEIERAPPTVDGDVETQTTVQLPERIANSDYSLVLSTHSETLTLEHPHPDIETEIHLSLPDEVTAAESTVDGGELVITVQGPAGDRTLTIEEADG